MVCRNCGTEIADKALICYRCGQATTDPVRQPPQAKRAGARWVVTLLALIALMLGAVYLGQAGSDTVPPAVPYTIAAVAIVVLVWRQLRRRR